MALNKVQLIKLYSNRLVKSLVPVEFGEAFIQSVINDLQTTLLNTPSEEQNLSIIINKLKMQFLSNNLKNEWVEFQNIVNSLSKFKSLDQICNYLVFLDALRDEKPEDILSTSSASLSPGKQTVTINTANTALTLSQLIEPYYDTLSEQTILTYLPYTMLGLDSKIFTFSDNYTRLEIPRDINNSFSSLLREVFEFAILYKQLAIVVDKYKGTLVLAIKTAYIAILEAQLNKYVNDINNIFSNKPNSILVVYNSAFPWISILRFLYRVSNRLNRLDGYEFLTFIYSFTNHGDPKIRDIAVTAFTEVVKPYYNIVEHWIVKGELIDNNNEFFIVFDQEQNEFNSIIKLLPKKIPAFIESSDRIFQIGKTLIFLNKYCRELKWVNQYNVKYSAILFNNHQGLSSMTTNEMIKLIDLQYNEILTFLTQIIQGNNKLFTHIYNFKRFYFMETNDFIDAIMVKGKDVFNESSVNISSTYLRKVLQEAIQISSVKNFEYVDRLDSRVLNPQHGNLGWESFTIEYKIDDLPMSYLFEGHQHLQYLKMFHFLWKLRQLNNLLNWHFEMFNELNHNVVMKLTTRNRRPLLKSLSIITSIRFHFTQFLNELIAYLSYDVIEENFQQHIVRKLFYNKNDQDLLLNKLFMNLLENQLTNNLPKFNVNLLTIDELVELHGTYIDSIINSSLLNEKVKGNETNVSYIDQIFDILQTIFNFINTSQEFYSLVVNFGLLVKLDNNTSNIELEQDQEDLEFQLHKIKRKIYKDIYQHDYKRQLNDLKNDLNRDYNLKDLSKLL